jgi:hypothetical protein
MNDRIDARPIGQGEPSVEETVDENWGGVISKIVLRPEYVGGLDAGNGTPVVDLKPYYPQYDRVENARIPEWVDELMRRYS